MKRLILTLLAAISATAFAQQEVRLYSERHYDADKKIFADFTKATGIEVKVVKAGANELIARLEAEKSAPQADLYLTSDAASLTRATKAGLLSPLESKTIEDRVPANLRGKEGTWTAFTMRGRVIVYAKDRVKGDLPKTYADLASPAYRGNLLIRSSSSKYNRSLLAALIAHEGKAIATNWAQGIAKNLARPPQGGDRDQIRGVAQGLADFAVTNTYYLGIMEKSESEADRKARAAVGVIFPSLAGHGTHVNISGGGLVKGAANRDHARKFLEYLVSPEVQAEYQKLTSEYAVSPGIPLEPLQKAWGELTPDVDALQVMGDHDQEAVKIFNFVGWK